MVGPPFIRPLYPPDAAKKGRVPSPDGDDILPPEPQEEPQTPRPPPPIDDEEPPF